MPQRNWQGGGAPNPGDWDQANNWVGGVVPVDGDTVVFLAADWVADPTAGPAAAVTLISITDDAGFEGMGGANAQVCYATITVTTITLLSDCRIEGDTVATANLSGAAPVIRGGTFGLVTLGGANAQIDAQTAAVTATTVNCDGANARVAGPNANAIVIGTVNLNGLSARVSTVGGGAGDITVTTVNMNGNTAEIRHIINMTLTTVYVYGNACEISATTIAAGNITNGPYVRARDLVLLDYDTGEVMMDTSWVLPNHEGSW